MNRSKKFAKIAVVIICIVLIRTITEPLRLQYYSATSLTFMQIKPFLIAASITSCALLAMVLLYFYDHYKIVIAFAAADIIIMVIIKILMLPVTP